MSHIFSEQNLIDLEEVASGFGKLAQAFRLLDALYPPTGVGGTANTDRPQPMPQLSDIAFLNAIHANYRRMVVERAQSPTRPY